jgi:hypothetical protein
MMPVEIVYSFRISEAIVVRDLEPDLINDIDRQAHRQQDFQAVDFPEADQRHYTSKFATFSAFPTINSRRGSTTSPISVLNTCAASSESPTFT